MAEEVITQMADQLETAGHGVAEVTRRITSRDIGFFSTGMVIGVANGLAIGYMLINKRLESKYEKIVDEEIAKMREQYKQLTVALKGEAERRRPLEELVVEKGYVSTSMEDQNGIQSRRFTEEEQAAIDEANAKHPDSGEEAEAPVGFGPTAPEVVAETVREHRNVFVQESGWDYAVEVKSRSSDVPYIIHVDEFRENEPEHEQVTLTYYEEDDVLADQRNTTVDDMDAVIGLGNLGRWGHGSNDPNITYVRNEELKLDVEILRDRGGFHETIHSIRHSSNQRRPPSSRGFDDD